MKESDKVDHLLWEMEMNIREIKDKHFNWQQLNLLKGIIVNLEEIEATNE